MEQCTAVTSRGTVRCKNEVNQTDISICKNHLKIIANGGDIYTIYDIENPVRGCYDSSGKFITEQKNTKNTQQYKAFKRHANGTIVPRQIGFDVNRCIAQNKKGYGRCGSVTSDLDTVLCKKHIELVYNMKIIFLANSRERIYGYYDSFEKFVVSKVPQDKKCIAMIKSKDDKQNRCNLDVIESDKCFCKRHSNINEKEKVVTIFDP